MTITTTEFSKILQVANVCWEGKCKFNFAHTMKASRESKPLSQIILNSALNGGEWLELHSGRFEFEESPPPTTACRIGGCLGPTAGPEAYFMF